MAAASSGVSVTGGRVAVGPGSVGRGTVRVMQGW